MNKSSHKSSRNLSILNKTMVGLTGPGIALALAKLAREQAKEHNAGIIVVVPDSLAAAKLEQALAFFLAPEEGEEPIPIYSFPDWETLPYDSFSPHQDIISERLRSLYHLPHLKNGLLIVPVQTLMHKICPKEFIMQNTLMMERGERIDLDKTRHLLQQSGYRCTAQVLEHGEFAVRGSILDLFPMGSRHPFRIDLFDNEIDSIRTFDVESQRSLEKIDKIRLLPAREFPLDDQGITEFRTHWREQFEGDPRSAAIYLDVTEGHASPGLEYYLPLFFDKTATLFDYFPSNSLIALVDDLELPATEFIQYVKDRYEQYRHDRQKPILEPKALFLAVNELFSAFKEFPNLRLKQKKKIDTNTDNIDNSDITVTVKSHTIISDIQTLPDLSLEARHEHSLFRLEAFLAEFKGRVLFTAETAGRREILKDLLKKIRLAPIEVNSWFEFLDNDEPFNLAIAVLDEGMILSQKGILFDEEIDDDEPEQNLKKRLAIIPEAVLLGKRVPQPRRRSKHRPSVEMDLEVRSLAELGPGSPVVHIDYGIGRFLGLQQLTLKDQEGEFVCLEYAGGDKLYLPVSSLHLLSRYSGVDLEHAPLHRLGTPEWQKVKHKVLEQTRDVAAELLEIYAKREAKTGFAFKAPDEQYQNFAALFPFEETVDQQQAIEQVLRDLTKPKPMDRVVCGDVGFGKTEVALRAAFLAVEDGKQVAVLVPTTLLAQQHYQTFTDRFAGFPVRIDVLSRFKARKEQDKIIEALNEGKIDIVIGTHKMLQNNIKFKALGLLIIDEEHRFGVRQKEAFKAFRAEVDILTLTATPIPRTLNMAMSGIRDLSIIASPPAKRLSVKTFVRERNPALIQEAILRELHRGGQVYFLHNFVETIDNTKEELEKLIPTARIAIAHGQMRERELEQIMSDFYHRRYNVLVCTTIIETGIDIPTANTIIIERADKFGLAQLHQLRGRVGRSHHQAYAFCLIPSHAKISSDAKKRLDAIESLDELGVGFSLATHDLEIRGAGELLGEEQSGNIQSVGFPLFMELLDHAVKLLRQGKDPKQELPLKKNVEIDLHVPAFIPESYLGDVHSRLVLYKRISSAKNKNALEDIAVEMIDRFGKFPEQIRYLFKITELRLLAEKLGIHKIDAGPQGGRIEFGPNPQVDPLKIIKLIQEKPKQFALEGPHKLRFKELEPLIKENEKINLENSKSRTELRETRIEALMDWLGALAAQPL